MKPDVLKSQSFHFWLVAIFFLLFGLNQFQEGIHCVEIFIGAGITLIYVILLLLISRKLIKDKINAGIFTTLLIVFTLFFGNISTGLKYFQHIEMFSRSRYILILLSLIILGLFYFLKKSKSSYLKFNQFLNVLFLIYILIETFRLVYKLNDKKPDEATTNIPEQKNQIVNFKIEGNKPDVYFFLLDAYASNHSLKKYWNFENKTFTKFLTDNDFQVFNKGISSYKTTIRSVASILNMDYLPRKLDDLPETNDKNKVLSSLIENDVLVTLFEKNGYKIFNNSIFQINNYSRFLPDYNFHNVTFLHSLYNRTVYKNLFAGMVEYVFIDKDLVKYHQLIIDKALLIANDTTNSEVPKFVYSHLLLPHEPFVLDSIGNTTQSMYWLNDQPDAYLQQLKYINKLMMEMLSKLKNKKNAIIIITGDHGYRYFLDVKKNKEVSFSAFTAIRFQQNQSFPNKINSDIIASPNIFRYVLRKGFDAPIELLKDSSNLYY